MARIRTYQSDTNVTSSDKWIGTDGNDNNNTKNFSPNSLADFFNKNESISNSSIRFTYDTIASGSVRKEGTLSFKTEIGPTVPISSLTTFMLSRSSEGGNYVDHFLQLLNSGKIIIHKSDNIDIYGLFKVNSVTADSIETSFYNVSLTYISGNGSLEEDKDYLITLVDLADVDVMVTKTSQLTNDGSDGSHPFISLQEVPPIPSISGLATVTYVDQQDLLKVDKVIGKDLSTNDFTDTSKTKLDGIADGAEVNVNADWDAVSGDSFIVNKPTIPTQTSQLTNNGANGINPFITALDIPTFASADKMVTIGRNATGTALYRGMVVYISGSTGNRPNFVKAKANSEGSSAGTFGVVLNDIPDNSDGSIVTIGAIDNLDTRVNAIFPFTTDTLVDGDTIYLSPTIAGYVTNIKPSAPNHLVYVGKVTRTSPTNGTIVYRIQNGYELEELHNVAINESLADNNILSYEASSSLWKNKSLALAGIQSILTNPITGTGTTNYIPKFTGTSSLGNSLISDNGTDVNVNTIGANNKLIVGPIGYGIIQLSTDAGQNAQLKFNFGGDNFLNILTTYTANGNKIILSPGNITSLSTFRTGNTVLQSGGTFVDDGVNRLQVNGGAKITGTTTATSAIARGMTLTPTLVASANNDVLVGLDIQPTFNNGAFTGVQNLGARIAGSVTVISPAGIISGGLSITSLNSTPSINFNQAGGAGRGQIQITGGAQEQFNFTSYVNGGTFSWFTNSTTQIAKLFSTGNLLLQNGGTFTDDGVNRLQVNGGARIQDILTLTTGTTKGINFAGTKIVEANNQSTFTQILIQPNSGNKAGVFQFAPSGTSTASVMEFYSSSSLSIFSRFVFKNDNGVLQIGGDAALLPITFISNNIEKLRISSNGNLGVNTTTPTSKLHVNGIQEYATNALAITGGLTAGAFYHTSGVLKIVI